MHLTLHFEVIFQGPERKSKPVSTKEVCHQLTEIRQRKLVKSNSKQ